jgi:hypothetical protein
MADLQFQGETYNDDRMFVLHLGRCTVRAAEDSTKVITVHHESSPSDSRLCVVTYRNTRRYPPTGVEQFDSLAEARAYIQRIEPTVPRVSLAGRSPVAPLPYDQWLAWKAANLVKEYDYRTVFPARGQNPIETLYYNSELTAPKRDQPDDA